MSESIRIEESKKRVGMEIWPDQYEWLRNRAESGRRPRAMAEVLREIIDDAMNADSEKQGN